MHPMLALLPLAQPLLPWPRVGHKLQLNASAFTVNDYECLQIDTGDWPSERVHCELRPDDTYDWIVEHFDDAHCERLNRRTPSVQHTTSGCFFFGEYNHSYNDNCHPNRTLTVSAFFGPGCVEPMPVTAVNLPAERLGLEPPTTRFAYDSRQEDAVQL